MLVDYLLRNNIASALLQGMPVYDMRGIAKFCAEMGIGWAEERFSARNKLPPVVPFYAEYEYLESGSIGSDHWSIGVLVKEMPAATIAEAVEQATAVGAVEFPEQCRRFFVVDAFTRINAQRRGVGFSEPKLPTGVVAHQALHHIFGFDEKGSAARTLALMDRSGLAPFGFPRLLSQYTDSYYPVGNPWMVFAAFGLVAEGTLEFAEAGGRLVLRRA